MSLKLEMKDGQAAVFQANAAHPKTGQFVAAVNLTFEATPWQPSGAAVAGFEAAKAAAVAEWRSSDECRLDESFRKMLAEQEAKLPLLRKEDARFEREWNDLVMRGRDPAENEVRRKAIAEEAASVTKRITYLKTNLPSIVKAAREKLLACLKAAFGGAAKGEAKAALDKAAAAIGEAVSPLYGAYEEAKRLCHFLGDWKAPAVAVDELCPELPPEVLPGPATEHWGLDTGTRT